MKANNVFLIFKILSKILNCLPQKHRRYLVGFISCIEIQCMTTIARSKKGSPKVAEKGFERRPHFANNPQCLPSSKPHSKAALQSNPASLVKTCQLLHSFKLLQICLYKVEFLHKDTVRVGTDLPHSRDEVSATLLDLKYTMIPPKSLIWNRLNDFILTGLLFSSSTFLPSPFLQSPLVFSQ